MKKIIFSSLCLPFGMIAFGQNTDSRFEGIEQEIQRIMEDYKGVGLSVAIVEHHKIRYLKGFGYRDEAEKLPVTVNTVFPIGSNTKAFTAALIGILEVRGKLKLQDKPAQYIPAFRFNTENMDQSISIEDLLEHKSGVGGVDGTFVLFPAKDRMELIKRARYLKPAGEPKGTWLYSNFGYAILGAIAEQQFGNTWDNMIKQEIFDPLQMSHSSTFIDSMIASGDYSKAYGLKDGKVVEVLYQKVNNDKPGGGINSSAADMAQWMKMWLGKGTMEQHRILPENYVNEAISLKAVINGAPPQTGNNDNYMFGYGYGWHVNIYKDHYRVYHGGGVSGFSSNVVLFPVEGIGIVVLTNQHNSSLPYTVNRMLAERLLGINTGKPFAYTKEQNDINTVSKNIKSVNQEKKPGHLLADYCGNYFDPGYGNIKIIMEHNYLFAVLPEYKFQLEHQYYNTFTTKLLYDIPQQMNPEFDLTFATDDKSHISHLKLDLQKGGVIFKKVRSK